MQHGVAEYGARRRLQSGRRADAEEHERAEQRGREERATAQQIEDEEPDGDDGGADEAGDDAFADDRTFGRVHGLDPGGNLTANGGRAGGRQPSRARRTP